MNPSQKASEFENALTAIAQIAKRIGETLGLKADAQQACFATILISADRNGLLFSLANPELPNNGHTQTVSVPAQKDAQAAAKADAQIQDAPRQPTQAQAEAGAAKALREGIKRACLLLNQDGFTPALSSMAKNGAASTLDQYIKKETQLPAYADMDSEDLEALTKNLSMKLDTFRANKKALEGEAGF